MMVLYLQLVCGGVAGSTAALFTTPFDVVKTRLQTQIPGSLSPYKSVIQALYEIGKKEGLQGLYRYALLWQSFINCRISINSLLIPSILAIFHQLWNFH